MFALFSALGGGKMVPNSFGPTSFQVESYLIDSDGMTVWPWANHSSGLWSTDGPDLSYVLSLKVGGESTWHTACGLRETKVVTSQKKYQKAVCCQVEGGKENEVTLGGVWSLLTWKCICKYIHISVLMAICVACIFFKWSNHSFYVKPAQVDGINVLYGCYMFTEKKPLWGQED